MRTADEIEVLEMKVRGLEHETRQLREGLRDKFYRAALGGLLAHGYGPMEMVVSEAWRIADETIRPRNESQS